jgi:hypothetical protein
MPVAEIILHIGLEKTGSTSIQMFLDDHKDMLRWQGIACSGCLGWFNHKLLAAYAMDDGSRDVAVTSAGIESPQSHHAFRERTRGHVLGEIAHSEASRHLITSEDLSRLATPGEVRRVHDLLSPMCDRLRVVVFLRRQDRLAVSRHYWLLVNGGVPPAVFPARGCDGYYDYAAMLDIWADVFGADAIRLVHYPEAPETTGFDAVAAFCQAADIALPAGWQQAARRDNRSLDIVSQTVLETVNRHSAVLCEKHPGRRLRETLRALDGGVPGQFVTIAEARAFADRFAAGNARLATRFGLAEPLFGDDFSMYPERPPDPAELAHAAMVRMVDVVAKLLARPPQRA